jgi:hypothetical protein
MSLGVLLERLQGVRRTGQAKWLARCPAHDDKNPSLSLAERNGQPLLHCHSGCEPLAILEAVGLQWSDILPPLEREAHQRPIQAVRNVAEERARAEIYLETLQRMVRYEQHRPTEAETQEAKRCLSVLRNTKISDGWT